MCQTTRTIVLWLLSLGLLAAAHLSMNERPYAPRPTAAPPAAWTQD